MADHFLSRRATRVSVHGWFSRRKGRLYLQATCHIYRHEGVHQKHQHQTNAVGSDVVTRILMGQELTIICRNVQRAVTPASIETYEQYAKKHSIQPNVVTLPHGTKGGWLGDKSHGTVVLWLHGSFFFFFP